jgi:NADP-dependent 3-hydroxy acid dehydrogenase YdfG
MTCGKKRGLEGPADYVRRKFRRIDVLVNNAGIYLIKPVAGDDG